MRVQDRYIEDFDDFDDYDDFGSYNYKWTTALSKFPDENPRTARRRNQRKNVELARARRGKREPWRSYEEESFDDFDFFDALSSTDYDEPQHHY